MDSRENYVQHANRTTDTDDDQALSNLFQTRPELTLAIIVVLISVCCVFVLLLYAAKQRRLLKSEQDKISRLDQAWSKINSAHTAVAVESPLQDVVRTNPSALKTIASFDVFDTMSTSSLHGYHGYHGLLVNATSNTELSACGKQVGSMDANVPGYEARSDSMIIAAEHPHLHHPFHNNLVVPSIASIKECQVQSVSFSDQILPVMQQQMASMLAAFPVAPLPFSEQVRTLSVDDEGAHMITHNADVVIQIDEQANIVNASAASSVSTKGDDVCLADDEFVVDEEDEAENEKENENEDENEYVNQRETNGVNEDVVSIRSGSVSEIQCEGVISKKEQQRKQMAKESMELMMGTETIVMDKEEEEEEVEDEKSETDVDEDLEFEETAYTIC